MISPQRLIDSSGSVAWQAQYSAFGKADIKLALVENNLRFPGQYYDAESGLHQNWFRDYDARIGRYIQSDPIGILMEYKSNPQFLTIERFGQGVQSSKNDEDLNDLYAYSQQNPVTLVDPYGLKPEKVTTKQWFEFMDCFCSGGACETCCRTLIKGSLVRPSTVGICESMCLGEILHGQSKPIDTPVCDEFACGEINGAGKV